MDSETEIVEKEVSVVFEAASLENSEDPPMEEWSSLEIVYEQRNPKRVLEEEGLYDPGTPEVCAKYVALSASSVIRHVYYRYPGILDPGILPALLSPEDPIIYPDDGQDQYITLCKEMNQCVVSSFHKGLLNEEIDLSYYCVNPQGVRAMAIALQYNQNVRKINFTDNFLTLDACFHLSEMLEKNNYLVELNLSGCRIGPVGLQNLLINIVSNKTLQILNLCGNEIGDGGMVHFADAVFKGMNVRDINLSRNGITGQGVASLAEPFQRYNKITKWNLSWNNLYTPGTSAFLNGISETIETLTQMDLSYNGLTPRTGFGLKRLLRVRDIRHVNLSHNQLQAEGIKDLCSSLSSATKLETLNLGFNPMTIADACLVLKKLLLKKVKVNNINMDNVRVDTTFLKLLNEVKELKPAVNVTYGYVAGAFTFSGPDYRMILIKRLEYLCKKPKKKKVDFVLLLLQLKKDKVVNILAKEFYYMMLKSGAPVEADLMDEIGNMFAGPRAGRGEKTVNVDAMLEFATRLFPDRKLPPTPPPSVAPPQPAPSAKGKGKAKK